MTDEDAFIAGLREHPLDDLRRLVYADWLEERGRCDEAEYLRLVAALAAPGTAVDVKHPHAVRLVELADRLDHTWRGSVGARFDLWFDGYPAERTIHFIKLMRELSGLGLAEAKAFSESLPKVLVGAIPFEEAVWQAVRVSESKATFRILPNTEVPSADLLRVSIDLSWHHWVHDWGPVNPQPTEAQTRVALSHIRRLLSNDSEFAPLADGVPLELEPGTEWYAIRLVSGLSPGEAQHQIEVLRLRLLDDMVLHGEDADPPFRGSIQISQSWQ